MFYAIKPFYLVTGGLILACIIYIIVAGLVVPSIKKKKLLKAIHDRAVLENKTYSIIKDTTDNADFRLIVNDVTFLVKVVNAKRNCEVQITNNKNFVVYNKELNGNSKMNIIDGMEQFIGSKVPNRIILVNNSIKTMVRAVNENEIKKITPFDAIFGLHILSITNLDYIFKKSEM